MINSPHKPSRLMNWFYTGAVLIILLAGCFYIFTSDRQENFELFETQAKQNVLLLSEMIQIELLNNNYTAVINILEKWYQQHPSIYEIKIQAENGFILSDLKKDQLPENTFDIEHNIQYGYRGNATISVTNSLDEISYKNNKDIYYLLLISAIITLASGEFFWLIEQKRHNKILETLSYRDQLTEIFNRRYFDETLYQEWHRASRTNQSISLIMIDIDHFKQYNDQFGHQTGDKSLSQIAKVLHTTLKRPGEFVARYGGEEFSVVLPNTDFRQVKQIAEMLRQAILKLSIPAANKDSKNNIVTISLGTATHDSEHIIDSPETLIKNADRALYQAKDKGRNNVQSS
jgi:diguanylate cyclase (GGDEF)-like protein